MRNAINMFLAAGIGSLVIFMIIAGAIGLAFVYGAILLLLLLFTICQRGGSVKKSIVFFVFLFSLLVLATTSIATDKDQMPEPGEGRNKKLEKQKIQVIYPIYWQIKETEKPKKLWHI
jgi:hypothetical protein